MHRRDFLRTSLLGALAAPRLVRAASSTRGFEIGLVADAQYADVAPKGTRFYREGVRRLGDAVEHFNRQNMAFCVHLGDLIDREWRSFGAILQPLAGSRARWHHLLGNHDFDVLEELKPKVPAHLGMPARYGSFDHGSFRFIFLDTNDVSTYAHPADAPEHAAAAEELARLRAAKRPQAQPWNGAIGPAQLQWLDRTCTTAAKERRKVILLAHHPVAPAGNHNAWNADEILAVVDRHRHVVAWLNGHNHAGNFTEHNGVPFVTMKGMVETADTTAFATARVLEDRLILTGHGREPSRELVFRS